MSATKKWYQIPMVWMIIAIPLSAVIVGMIMLFFSIISYDGLVADDYYKRGKEINRLLTRDRYAKRHHISAELEFVNDAGVVVISLSADKLDKAGILELVFAHPTRSFRDRKIKLEPGPDGNYYGRLPELNNGRWKIELGNKLWRLRSEINWPQSSVKISNPD